MKTNGASGSRHAQPTFLPALQKVTICSLDDHDVEVAAQYNPKELGITKSVQWQDPKRLDNRRADQRSPTEGKDSEYTGGGVRSMTIELFFDRYEPPPKSVDTRPIEEVMDDLNTMASITDPKGEPEERRPHYCIVVWGSGGIRPFRCVIESLDIKYTMFDTMGIPLRATATVKVREAAMQVAEHEREKADRVVRARKPPAPR
jgi:hypothetical protein